MTYMKPEMDVEKFDIIEEITGEAESTVADTASANGKADSSVVVDEAIGTDLIVG